jgi:hypothetical protein
MTINHPAHRRFLAPKTQESVTSPPPRRRARRVAITCSVIVEIVRLATSAIDLGHVRRNLTGG